MSLTIAAMPAKSEERTTLQDGPQLQEARRLALRTTAAPTPGRRSSEALGGCKHIAPEARRRSRHASTGLVLMAYGRSPQRH